MTAPNFFEGMSAEEQVRALTGMVFEHVRRHYGHSDRTNDLEAVVDYAGSSEPIAPWVWEWALLAKAGE